MYSKRRQMTRIGTSLMAHNFVYMIPRRLSGRQGQPEHVSHAEQQLTKKFPPSSFRRLDNMHLPLQSSTLCLAT
ncbi:unnamed protein product [Protopolystoma xenopodis]|uniref:Uncharacterized protein n=1 Tax=Protopolystoma xenopodis TaxID=117903 RepID=A0A448WYH2_9PLAT|nr:unnamed protein product [Protopolystoma xenopodis]